MTTHTILSMSMKYYDYKSSQTKTAVYWQNHYGLYNLIKELFHAHFDGTNATQVYFNVNDLELIIKNLNKIDYSKSHYDSYDDDLEDLVYVKSLINNGYKVYYHTNNLAI